MYKGRYLLFPFNSPSNHLDSLCLKSQELNKERLKAAAALKSLQEKLEEKLKTELEQKVSLLYLRQYFSMVVVLTMLNCWFYF